MILNGQGDEIVDWDLRRYIVRQKEPRIFLRSIFEFILQAMDSNPNLKFRWNASKLLVGLSYLQETAIVADLSFDYFDKLRSRVSQERNVSLLLYALDCLEVFLSTRKEEIQQNNFASIAVWNIYQFILKHRQLSARADTTERFNAIRAKFDPYRILAYPGMSDGDFGFICPLCKSSVAFGSDVCPNQHPITVCSRTFTIIADPFAVMRCVGCNSAATSSKLRQFQWQRLPLDLCPSCGHRYHFSVL